MSIGQLAEKFKKDRRTIAACLKQLPFTKGQNRAHLYDVDLARAAIETADADVASFLHERLMKVRAEREMRELDLAEKRKQYVLADDITDHLTELAVQLRNEIDSWDIPESEKMKMHFKLQHASIRTVRICGSDTSAAEKDLDARERQFMADLKAGKIPHKWADKMKAENHARVWSQELGRYYTKKEIISKFGSGAQISPIDEILDEVAEAEADNVLRTEAAPKLNFRKMKS